jgi:hypothetical protein
MHETQTKELFTALAKAQGQVKEAELDKVNPHYRTRYASLGSIWGACRQALSSNGLSVIQGLAHDKDGKIVLESRLTHASGEQIVFFCPMLISKQDMQGLGGAITYARRYSLAALVGIVADEDDDSNSAPKPTTQKNSPPPRQEAPTPAAPKQEVNPRDFKWNYGKDKGKALRDLPWTQLVEFRAWASTQDKLAPHIKELLWNVEAFVDMVEQESMDLENSQIQDMGDIPV